MAEWSREERYRRLEDVESKLIEDLKYQISTYKYFKIFNIKP